MAKLSELMSRADSEAVGDFIAAEEQRLRERDEALAAQRNLGKMIGRVGDTLFGDAEEQADWAGAGVRKGAKGLAGGVLSGVGDILHEGSTGLRKDGTRGLVFGVAKGAASLGQNTAFGVAGLVRNTAEGVIATPTMALSITAGVSEAVDTIKEDGLQVPKLKRTTVEEAGEARKDEIASARRSFGLAMKHGLNVIKQAMKHTENGHEVMANVMLTLEMLSIQQISAEDSMAYLGDDEFDQLAELFNEVAQMEKTLRTHNVMKMAVYGILNKQKSNLTSLQFQKYVFSLEDGNVRYYVLGEVDEPEDSFSVHHVYDVGNSEKLKRSVLESVATLGMGKASLEESDNDEKRYAFKISVVAPRATEDDAAEASIAEGVPPEGPVEEAEEASGHFASRGLGLAKKAAKKAAAAAESQKQQIQSRASSAELTTNDLRSVMRGKLVMGADRLHEMTSKNMVVAAPDQYSMDMWKTALRPVLDSTMKYRTRTQAAPDLLQPAAEATGDDAAEAAPEPAPEPAPGSPRTPPPTHHRPASVLASGSSWSRRSSSPRRTP